MLPSPDSEPLSAPRIIAYAYSATPGNGSEHAVGWMWSRLLAGLGEVWVLTKPFENGREEIERQIAEAPEHDRLHIVEVAPPAWLDRLPGARQGELFSRVEYVVWQFEALKVARRLHADQRFDLAWHLTWATAWLGSTIAFLGIPFVFGPVGGGVEPPWRLARTLGGRGLLSELQRTVVRTLARHLNPLAHVTWQRARVVLVQNPETGRWLPKRIRSKTVQFPNAILESLPPLRAATRPAGRVALYAGRLVPLKGVILAIRALARLPDWRLIVCGDGVDAPRLRRIAGELGITDRIDFRGMQPRQEVLRVMREEADVFLFPSFHDEGSLAVAEAVSVGLPVVCLDRGGPPVLGGIGVPIAGLNETVRLLAEGVEHALERGQEPHRAFDLETRREDVAAVLARFGLLAPG